jgi:demethylmenaquinone methyltransferase/2-methoxy-6-polyprenyl-1,4-benzoquinol methylase
VTAADDPVLAGQLRYYRARAAEYDETSYGAVTAERASVPEVVDALDIGGDVLELACGTGIWTRELCRTARTLTAVDGAPEMLALAREAVGDCAVDFDLADIFGYRPARRYDVVFFAAWLSHVPEARFDEFWSVVDAALAPGGRAVCVDELPSRVVNEPEHAGQLATRTLRDGSRHRIVKIFWEPGDLEARLAAIGWSAQVTPVVNDWFVATAQRQG